MARDAEAEHDLQGYMVALYLDHTLVSNRLPRTLRCGSELISLNGVSQTC